MRMTKKWILPLLPVMLLLNGCNAVKNILKPGDAAAAIREMLTIGANAGKNSLISKDALMQAILPGGVANVLQQVQQLGLSSEVDKFTNTLSTAATETVNESIPVFVLGIKKMDIGDAIGIVKNGGTSATDFLRSAIGDSLRRAVRPVMKTALDKYQLTQQWDKMVTPAKLFLGDKLKLNLDIDNLLAGVITNIMFAKIAERETAIRSQANERTTVLLQKVFGRVWNK
jgi:Protein of unknown function (DUF4197)